jgi:hypothetical protein
LNIIHSLKIDMNIGVYNNSLGYIFFHALPPTIIRDSIFREMLDLGDIARLEVAAATRLIRDSMVSRSINA